MRFAHLLSPRHRKARLLMWGVAAVVAFAKIADFAQKGTQAVRGRTT
jgi:hypothetical protein